MMQTVQALSLTPIQELDRQGHLKILEMRNQPEVRKNMYTAHEISEAEHLRWIDSLTDKTRFFAVLFDGVIVGGISLNAISHADRRADWAFYLDGSTQGKGIGSALEFKFLDYAFEDLQKLNCEVLDFNKPVIGLHKKFGFAEEGIRRRHIYRDGVYHDAHLLGITAEEWQERRLELTQGAFRE